MSGEICLRTALGSIRGNEREDCYEFLGVRYARAERFRYACPVTHWDGEYDATRFGAACPQTRTWYEHLEIPERRFYHREFREGLSFTYDEDCLNLNIFTPKTPGCYPVIVFIHGGGFNSGANCESNEDGAAFAQRGVVLVTINYRVGVLGYLTSEALKSETGREGNFGLDDQLTAIRWVREHIADFSGDPGRITLMGQSAGAISIQYLCLCEQCRGLFQRAIMMSGGGKFPEFALPRPAQATRAYWQQLMQLSGCASLEQFRTADLKTIFTAVEEIKKLRKDSVYNTMPVIDGFLLTAPVRELIKKPLPVDYLLGYTNNDMYAVLMGYIAHRYARQNNAYLYYFDIDAPGDDRNGAFHSCDLHYVFGTLSRSFRPYTARDYEVSRCMTDYFANFVKTGNPNADDLPSWERGGARALRIADRFAPVRPAWGKLLFNTLTKGDPK